MKAHTINFIQSLLARSGLTVQRIGMPSGNEIDILKLLVDRLPVDGADFKIVQIGANDGMSGDPVYPLIMERGWSGVLVEPLPMMFEKLSNTYRNMPNIQLDNCAIANKDGIATLYRVIEDDSLPKYLQQVASFERSVILKQKRVVPNIERFIEKIDVPTKTMNSLLITHRIKHINLLQIDTEGFDYEIIKMTFESGLQPDIINFESTHLSPQQKSDCGHLLASKNYHYLTIGRDTIAAQDTLLQISN